MSASLCASAVNRLSAHLPQRRRGPQRFAEKKFHNTRKLYFGDAAGLTETGELVAAGLVAAGLAAGCCVGAGVEPVAASLAGRRPRLLGLLSMFVARLLMTFASFIATSNNAALRICFRWFVSPWVICCR